MFYTCPTDANNAEEWFVDLWNYSITPYFLHAIKCGIKLYGQRHEWIDPLEWILKTYPWNDQMKEGDKKSKLRRIRPEDVGYQTSCSNTPPQVHCKWNHSVNRPLFILASDLNYVACTYTSIHWKSKLLGGEIWYGRVYRCLLRTRILERRVLDKRFN